MDLTGKLAWMAFLLVPVGVVIWSVASDDRWRRPAPCPTIVEREEEWDWIKEGF